MKNKNTKNLAFINIEKSIKKNYWYLPFAFSGIVLMKSAKLRFILFVYLACRNFTKFSIRKYVH